MSKNIFIKRRGHRLKRVLHGIVKGMVIGAAAGAGRGEKGMQIGVENGLQTGSESAKQINQQVIENSLIYLIHYWANVPIAAQPETGEVKPVVAQNVLSRLGFSPQPDLTWRIHEEIRRTKMGNRVLKHAERWSMLNYEEQIEELQRAYAHAGFIPFNIEVLKPPSPANVIFPSLDVNRKPAEKSNEPDSE